MDETTVVEVQPRVKVMLDGCGDSWSAYVPSVPGCIAAGASRDEVVRLIQDGLTIYLVDRHEQELQEIQTELDVTLSWEPAQIGCFAATARPASHRTATP